MKDYWLQMVAADKSPAGSSSGSLKQIPFSTFWRVWYEEFSFMKFRAASSHSQCGQCLRHKLLLREMSGYIHAREEQARLFSLHLKKQYADRMVYLELPLIGTEPVADRGLPHPRRDGSGKVQLSES